MFRRKHKSTKMHNTVFLKHCTGLYLTTPVNLLIKKLLARYYTITPYVVIFVNAIPAYCMFCERIIYVFP